MFLGRFQIGSYIPLRVRIDQVVAPWSQLAYATRFTARVRVTIIETTGNTVVDTLDLSPVNIFEDPRVFYLEIPTNTGDYAVGHHAAMITTAMGSDTIGIERSFELLEGNSDGAVQSLVNYEFETGEHCVFETDNGDMQIGRRPH